MFLTKLIEVIILYLGPGESLPFLSKNYPKFLDERWKVVKVLLNDFLEGFFGFNELRAGVSCIFS